MNRVPHNPPLDRGEGPANYVAGWNLPGYLPEMEPEFFSSFDDAKRFVLNSLGELEDDCATRGDESLAEEVAAMREELNLTSSPFVVLADGYHYWVELVA